MKLKEVLNLPSMPLASPSYPRGPYRFIDREYMIVTYESDPGAIRAQVPEPLEPDGSNTVLYEFIKMPDSAGFGSYEESGVVIPCTYQGEKVNFTSQMYLNVEPPIAGGREIWGFPKKNANPKMTVRKDTLTGVLEYAGVEVAVATMAYKHEHLISLETGEEQSCDREEIADKMAKTQVNLKLIPDVDGKPAILQLVAYNMNGIEVKGAWEGPARLDLRAHVNAPVADLPVRQVLRGTHFIADMTLPYGRVLHNYLA